MPIQFLQMISWTKSDGSTPKEVIWKSKKPCVGHSRTQAAAIAIQTTRNQGSSFIRNSRTALPKQKNHSISNWLRNSLTKRERNANSLAYMKFYNLDPLWQNPALQRQSLTVRKPAKPQPKRRRNTASLDEPNDNGPTFEQPIISIIPAPPMPTSQERQESSVPSDQREQNAGRKWKRPQFYGFTDADISPTSALAWTSLAKPKKRKTKKEKKNSTTTNSVVALIQDAEQSRISSPPRPDIQIAQTSPPDSRIRFYEYEQERELSVRDAEN